MYRTVCLFKAFCTLLYTAHLWSHYKNTSIQKLQAAHNDAMRLFLKQPWWCSASQKFISAGVSTFHAVVRNLTYRFMCCLEESEKSIVVQCNPVRSCSCYSSRLRVHWLKSLFVNYYYYYLNHVCSFYRYFFKWTMSLATIKID